MSTRSSITVKCKDEKFRSVYCHFDGYIEGVGHTLLKNYNSQELARKIVNLGDLSSLFESVEDSVFYGRDRKEDNVNALVKNTYKECMRENKQQYNYLWDGEKWLVDGKMLKLSSIS